MFPKRTSTWVWCWRPGGGTRKPFANFASSRWTPTSSTGISPTTTSGGSASVKEIWTGRRGLYLRGKLPEAAERLAAATRLDPGYVEAHYRLALAFIRLGRRADAVAELRTVLRLAPKGPFTQDAREQLALLE
jgi:tetratricopeptide (TPR) repeat protein